MNRLGVFFVAALITAVTLGLWSCSSEEEELQFERALFLEVDQEVVVPTSVVRVVLGGTDRMEENRATIAFDGEVGERSTKVEFEVDAVRDGEVGDLYVDLPATDLLWPQLEPNHGEWFRGSLEVSLSDDIGRAMRGHLENFSLRFLVEMRPDLELDAPSQIFANATIEVEGSGILRPEEGETVAVVEGGQLSADAGHVVDFSGQILPVDWVGRRDRGALRFDPAIIGVHPGALEATVRFENRFSDGTVLEASSGEFGIDSRMDVTFIATMSPQSASRGQLVYLEGRGFVPGGGQAYGMVLRFEGTFTPADTSLPAQDFQGSAALERTPFEVRSDELIAQEVWYSVEGRSLEGLGATPGRFEGSITPMVYDAHGEVYGVAWEGQFDVLPTKQVVYLKYLPAFSVALDRYGLANVERQIRDRILEVVNRDYSGVNVEFVEEPPEDFVAYATVELGGPDPTGGSSFGFDNTYHDQPKDTGNLYIDDYLGGINHQTGEAFNNPYGGVFVESFANFSPTLHPEMGHASDNFDRLFGPFMPELGGDRVRATEWPNGERADEIAEAIQAFGSVVANTVSHEMGHALGMAHFPNDWESPGHRFHNLDAEGCIMDAGVDRSFEQRAEIEGYGPAEFSPRNQQYLEQILPLP